MISKRQLKRRSKEEKERILLDTQKLGGMAGGAQRPLHHK